MTVGPIVLAASVLVIIGIFRVQAHPVAAGDASETTSSSATLPF